MSRHRLTILWAYFIELALVLIIYCMMHWRIGSDRLGNVIQENWQAFSTIGGVLFAGGLAALLFVGQLLGTDFGKYMAWRKADRYYLNACKVQTILFLIAAILPFGAALGRIRAIGHAAWVLFLYACVNGITLVVNTVDLVRLRQKFYSEYNRAHPRDKDGAQDTLGTTKRPS